MPEPVDDEPHRFKAACDPDEGFFLFVAPVPPAAGAARPCATSRVSYHCTTSFVPPAAGVRRRMTEVVRLVLYHHPGYGGAGTASRLAQSHNGSGILARMHDPSHQ